MDSETRRSDVKRILQKATNLEHLGRAEILTLLRLTDKKDLQSLYDTACGLRDRYFYKKIFLYGFIYFSTWCRNSCTFCAYRSANGLAPRYRKSQAEIHAAVLGLLKSGVHLVDLTMGEDPFYRSGQGLADLFKLVKQIKQETDGLPVMISPGVISETTIQDFAQAGADWYACYQETYNQRLFAQLRLDQSFAERLLSKYQAVRAGLLVEEGLLLGVGETQEDIAAAIENMRALGARQVRVMSFVPQRGIPLENIPSPNRQLELTVIAVLRLVFPDKLIPASLDVDGIDGLAARLAAGANVVTSLIPPHAGLAGVAQHSKDIDDGYRTVAGVAEVLEAMELKAATRAEYREWLENQKRADPKNFIDGEW
ncbi:7,8-didemethyl-8-hydroxy-5-deazariboflavin synthase/methylornithine synthase [Acididesulfobacillus acetoxydans]|uniref:3-methylornithine synthase n=1 Tax=Acididesulfobacillus acetoxydans TaxID=1561005 RepID=A0A8S0X241_9FIRM|nr:methylornithine synthase PylB [Acididesulfobacillus acetoxydans]CAA7603421.1 7,8-didemethyl-8-hydroxy-5-deazariboflavin synthase/methylornithine synthase [Acididesulfobacillus acetoxydans]CEJ07164.1 3-methylornithine synthase [Acididesulfobacillus acetoxydans]